MTAPALCPTTTQRVRSFLLEQGLALRPWSGLDETFAELYALLNRRKDDPAFWAPVAQLLRAVVGDTAAKARRLAAPDAELLASWDVDQLVADLRAALPGGEPTEATQRSAVERFGTRLSSPVLAGFLLLGVGLMGCGRSAPGPVAPAVTGSPEDTTAATSQPLQPPEQPGDPVETPPPPAEEPPAVSSSLRKAIAASPLTDQHKELVNTCVAELDDSWDDGLTALFETASADTIAGVLERMAGCVVCEDGEDAGSYRVDFLATLCGVDEDAPGGRTEPGPAMIPLYKGVSFPRSA